MNDLARSTMSAAKLVAKWNEQFPVGTPVRFWTGAREGIGKMGCTRSAAEVLCGTAVVWIYDVVGCVALTHVVPEGDAPDPPRSDRKGCRS
jgi:hypothetical protein